VSRRGARWWRGTLGGSGHPGPLSRRDWYAALRRSLARVIREELTDWAAVLSYYSIQSIFPALLVVVALFGLIGRQAAQPLIDSFGDVTPGAVEQVLTTALQTLQRSQGTATVTVLIGVSVALWSASGYVAAFRRAANSVYGIDDERPIYKTLGLRVGLTMLLVLLLAISALALVITGGLAEWAGQILGVGRTTVAIWNVAKWPGLLLVVSLIFAILYWAGPDVTRPRFRWITAGSVLAVVTWVAVSAGFGFYAATFGSYNRMYGALAGMIVFLVWLWLSNIALLLGLAFNAELERARAPRAGGIQQGSSA
jgi:membrane protein